MNPLVLRVEGLLAYAAILAVLGVLLHWGIGPASVELGALVFTLGLLVPSLAVKQVPPPPSPQSGDVSMLLQAEVKPAVVPPLDPKV